MVLASGVSTAAVRGATVSVYSTPQSTTTNAFGEFGFYVSTATPHTVMVWRNDLTTYTDAFTVADLTKYAGTIPILLQEYQTRGEQDVIASGTAVINSNTLYDGTANQSRFVMRVNPQTSNYFNIGGTLKANSTFYLINLDLTKPLPFPLPSIDTRATALNTALSGVGVQAPIAVAMVRPANLQSLNQAAELLFPANPPGITGRNPRILYFDPATHKWTDTGFTYNTAKAGNGMTITKGGVYGAFEETGDSTTTKTVTGQINAPAGTLVFLGDKFIETTVDNQVVEFKNVPVPFSGAALTVGVILNPDSVPSRKDTTVNMTVAGSPVIDPMAVAVESVDLATSKTTLVANNTDKAVLTATVKGEDGALVPQNTQVKFTTNAGVFQTSNTDTITVGTDASGKAQATLLSNREVAPDVVVTAEAQSVLSEEVELVFVPDVVAQIAFETTQYYLTAGSGDTRILRTVVQDQWGHPVADGTVITFLAYRPDNQLDPGVLSGATTTTNGSAQVQFTASDNIGNYTVTASSANSVQAATPVTIRHIPSPVQSVTLTGGTSLVASGAHQTRLEATVTYTTGGPVADGTVVVFTTTAGGLSADGSISAVKTLNTAAYSGKAYAWLTSSTTVGTATVTATEAGGVSGNMNVSFVPGAPSQIAFEDTDETLVADGVSSFNINVVVTDAYGHYVVNGTQISFNATGPNGAAPQRLSSTTGTVTNGIASVKYTASQVVGNFTVTAFHAGGAAANPVLTVHQAAPSVGSVTVTSSNSSIVANGAAQTTITATVRYSGTNSLVADGTAVTFTTDAGGLSGGAVSANATYNTTTVGGVATAKLTSGTTLGTAQISATAGGASGSTSVQFVPGPVAQIAFTGTQYTLTANGGDQVSLAAVVTDAQGHFVSDGQAINFSSIGPQGSDPSRLSAISAQTVSGNVSVTFTASKVVGNYTVNASSSGGVTALVPVTVKLTQASVGQITVTSGQSELVAGGTSQTTVQATVLYSNNQTVADGTLVTFTTTAGGLSSGGVSVTKTYSTTTSNGIATATLTSGTNLGTAQITATSGSLTSAARNVNFVPGPVSSLAFETTGYTRTADGLSQIALRVIAQDAYNHYVASGTQINFTATGPGGVGMPQLLSATSATTNANGVAQVTFTASTTTGYYTVNANSTNGVSATKAVTIELVAAGIQSVNVTTGNASLVAGGSAQTGVQATIQLSNGQPVANGTSVVFSTTGGGLSSGAAGATTTYTTTTVNGIASATLTSSQTLGPVTITATLPGGNIGAATVNFVPGPAYEMAFVDGTAYSLTADGNSTQSLRARVKDQYNHLVEDGASVNFSVTGPNGDAPQMLSALSATTSGGFATVNFIASTTTGNYTVRAYSTTGAQTLVNATVELVEPTVGSAALTTGASSIRADGQSQTNLRAVVNYLNGQPVKNGTPVVFTTTSGGISSGAVSSTKTYTATTTSGIAVAMLTSSQTAGTAVVGVNCRGALDSANVDFVAGPLVNVYASASPAILPADGSSTSTITAWATDQYNNLIDTTPFSFGLSGGGNLNPTSGTTSNGIISTTYTAGLTPGASIITARGAGGVFTQVTLTTITAPVGSISLGVDPAQIRANGGVDTHGQSTVTATLADTKGDPMIAGTQVVFTTTAGTFLGATGDGRTYTTVVAGSEGLATAVLKSSTTSGNTANVRASSGGVNSAYAQVSFTPMPKYLSLALSKSFVSSDNSDSSIVTASVLDTNFVPIQGVNVLFSTTGGQISASTVVTDGSGNAAITFQSGTVDRSNTQVTVTAGVNEFTETKSVPIEIRGTTITTSIGTTSLEIGGAAGTDKTTMTVTLLDAGNNPISGAGVTVNTSGSGAVSVTPVTTNVTGVDGTAQFQVTATSAGSVSLTATSMGATTAPVSLTIGAVGNVFRILTPTDETVNEHTNKDITVTVLAPDQGARQIENVVFVSSLGGWNGTGNSIVSVPVALVGGERRATAYLKSTEAGIAGVQVYDEDDSSLKDTFTAIFSAPASDAYQVSLQAAKSVINPNGGAGGASALTAKVKSRNGQPVINAPVQFTITNPTGGGEYISNVVVFTNSGGEAATNFVSGSASSDGGGVTITARVLAPSTARTATFTLTPGAVPAITRTDAGGSFVVDGFQSGLNVEVSGSVAGNDDVYNVTGVTASTLTLASAKNLTAAENTVAGAMQLMAYTTGSTRVVINGTPGSIVIGVASHGQEAAQQTAYTMPITVLVADNNGNPMPNTTVSLSLWPEQYFIGEIDMQQYVRIGNWVYAEDTNRNLILDQGEDVNGDGMLTPQNSAAGTIPQTVTTDANGIATFDHYYLKNFALWTKVRIRATTEVLGTETVAEKVYNLLALQSDIAAGVISPNSVFGTCPWCAEEAKVPVSPGSFDATEYCVIQPQSINGTPTGNNRCKDYWTHFPDYQTGANEYSNERGSVNRIDFETTTFALNADGASQVVLNANVLTESGDMAFNGERINFTATGSNGSVPGRLSATSTTTDLGTVSVIFTASTTPGTYTVTASAPDATVAVTALPVVITLTEPPIGTVTVSSTSTQLVANGASQTTILATVRYTNGQLVKDGTSVVFTTTAGGVSAGTVSTSAVYTGTTANGVAAAKLTSSATLGSATVTATAGGASGNVVVNFVADAVSQISLTANPSSLPGDGRSTSTLTASAMDAQGNIVEGAALTFDLAGLGQLSPRNGVVANGYATTIYTAGGEPGAATVTCRSTNGTVKTATLTLTAPSIQSVALTAEPDKIKARKSGLDADSTNKSTITATVTNTDSQPANNGTAVVFTTTQGVFEGATGDGKTYTSSTVGTTGRATAVLVSSTSSGVSAEVTAKCEGVSSPVVSVEFTPVPSQLAIFASKSFVRSDNSTTSDITASVLDSNNVPISDISVNFSADGGQISASSKLTDANGDATIVFRSGYVDRRNRVSDPVTVTAEAAGYTQSIPIQVTGTHIDLSATSTSLQAGASDGSETVTMTVKVLDYGNNPIPNRQVSVSITSESGGGDVTGTSSGAACHVSVGSPCTSFSTTDSQGELQITLEAEHEGKVKVWVESAGATSTQEFTIVQKGQAFMFCAVDGTNNIYPFTDTLYLTTDESQVLTVLAPAQDGLQVDKVIFVTSFGEWDGTGQTRLEVDVVTGDMNSDLVPEKYAVAELSSTQAGVASIQAHAVLNNGGTLEERTDIADKMKIYYSAPSSEAYQVTLQANRTVVSLEGDTATLRATVKNKSDQVVANAQVQFSIVNPVSGGEYIDPPLAATGADGVATAVFTSGTISTDQAGLTIQARVLEPRTSHSADGLPYTFTLSGATLARSSGSFYTDGFKQGMQVEVLGASAGNNYYTYTINSINTAGSQMTLSANFAVNESVSSTQMQVIAYTTDEIAIVIGGTAGSLTIGRSSVIYDEESGTAYSLPISVLVADTNGEPVPNAAVSLSLWPTQYATGYWWWDDVIQKAWILVHTAQIRNEDQNENTILDTGEDADGDGVITPANATAGVLSYSGTTNANGVLTLRHVYFKNYVSWIKVRLKGTTLVYGSETGGQVAYWLNISSADIATKTMHPFDSPYGLCPWCAAGFTGNTTDSTGACTPGTCLTTYVNEFIYFK
jgi:adhesin/invasin